MNKKLPDVQVGFRKGRGSRGQIVIYWILEKAREFQKNIYFCFFYDTMDVGNLTSASSAFSKSRLNIWKFLVHVLLKSSLKDIDCYLATCEIRAW